jgi:hypothetical protein
MIRLLRLGALMRLEHEPDVNPAVLAAGATAIAGRREKTVMAAGRGVWVIVTILHHRVWPRVVVVYLRAHCGVIVAMLGRHLVVLVVLVVPVVRSVLCVQRRWGHSSQCEREESQNEWL